jgi:hypothetical protein
MSQGRKSANTLLAPQCVTRTLATSLLTLSGRNAPAVR